MNVFMNFAKNLHVNCQTKTECKLRSVRNFILIIQTIIKSSVKSKYFEVQQLNKMHRLVQLNTCQRTHRQ
jgi:hypothetical protein